MSVLADHVVILGSETPNWYNAIAMPANFTQQICKTFIKMALERITQHFVFQTSLCIQSV